MPSKNSVNRPKMVTALSRRAQRVGAKRAQRDRRGLLQPARSSEKSMSGKVHSTALDLYFDRGNAAGPGTVTTKTLSRKRAKKIARNLKYAAQRKLQASGAVDESAMEVESGGKGKNKKEESVLGKLKGALWEVLGDGSSEPLALSRGAGTTLGGPTFV